YRYDYKHFISDYAGYYDGFEAQSRVFTRNQLALRCVYKVITLDVETLRKGLRPMNRKSLRFETTNGHRALTRAPERIGNTKVGSARDKITRVFRYLEALNQHRNPVPRHLDGQLWSLWLHDLPSHSSIQRRPARLNVSPVSKQGIGAEPGEQDFVFKVR